MSANVWIAEGWTSRSTVLWWLYKFCRFWAALVHQGLVNYGLKRRCLHFQKHCPCSKRSVSRQSQQNLVRLKEHTTVPERNTFQESLDMRKLLQLDTSCSWSGRSCQSVSSRCLVCSSHWNSQEYIVRQQIYPVSFQSLVLQQRTSAHRWPRFESSSHLL